MKCPRCNKDNPEDLSFCGYCGANLKQPQGPPLIQQLADNSDQLAALVERVAKAIENVWIRPNETREKHRTTISIIVVTLVAIVVLCTFWLASKGILDSASFTFIAGAVLGSLITLIGDLMLSE